MTASPAPIIELRDSAYVEYGRRMHAPAGYSRHWFCECPQCGLSRWTRSDNGEDGDKVIFVEQIDPIFDTPCDACMQVAQRAPEIYRWVGAVVMKLRADLTRKGDPNG